ncbi:uncharacterized protein LOC112041037 [Quercus suber]|uniref:uncharacterized protein LOC112041037 n=1 Tax=Quercus suber TaxID=58331 RepID=UPI000CE16CDE|nr:uncharacterized protein LOC112041037 [Quercus suber]
MVRQEDYEQYGNFLQADSHFVEPFLSGSQNPSMPIQSLPKVEIVTFKCGGNFSVDEDLLLISAWLNIGMDAVHDIEQNDEDEIMRQLLKGSTKQRKRRRYIEHDLLAGHKRLYLDYFADTPVYPPNLFQRRFWMSRNLFLHIQHEIEANESYFIPKRDNAQKWGLSSLQKITTTLRMLTYGVTADFMDEYVRIGESTTMKSLKKFVKAMVDIFSKEYLRSPNNEDIARLLANGERCGFPGMLGSIDCMHWK